MAAGTKRRGALSTTRRAVLTFLILILTFGVFVPVFALLPSLTPAPEHPFRRTTDRNFEIRNDMFWKDGKPFRIIGGDIHYFRILPEYWEDRLLRAKALGLNAIQTYVPWNLHEPKPGKLDFQDIADLVAFLKLCQKLDLLVMLRAGPYICGEWDLGGFPPWLLSIKPALILRSSDPGYLQLVDRWWAILLPKVAPLLYQNGGPIIMVQIENEYGSYGSDKAYLRHLVRVARDHLGDDVILYTTDGGSRETLEKGTIFRDGVFSAVDFTTGDDPWPIFKVQKNFNLPGRSPPLSSEFYTGWLTHWGEKLAQTDAEFTAAALEKILSRNGSAVLYMAHGGTNFGFYSGANTGADESDYKPDLISYDYDAPIKESGDVNNPKFHALRTIIAKYSGIPLRPIPLDSKKAAYGLIRLQKTATLFDLFHEVDPTDMIESRDPISMESAGEMFGLLLYASKFGAKKDISSLFIPKVHDRAQVFVSCDSENTHGRPTFVGTIERWSNQAVSLPTTACDSNISLFILVENMGRVNYGDYLFDSKGILSPVYLDGQVLHGWKIFPLPFHNLNEAPRLNLISQFAYPKLNPVEQMLDLAEVPKEPTLFSGHFTISEMGEIQDTYLSFGNWGKGIAFVNEFNVGRYWPSHGPQCNLYVPAPILRVGENSVVIFELDSPDPNLIIRSVSQADFTCGPRNPDLHQMAKKLHQSSS